MAFKSRELSPGFPSKSIGELTPPQPQRDHFRHLCDAFQHPSRACKISVPTPTSHKSYGAAFFAGVVVINTTLTSTQTVPTTVRSPSVSPPRKYPNTTATTGFTYAYVPTLVGDS